MLINESVDIRWHLVIVRDFNGYAPLGHIPFRVGPDLRGAERSKLGTAISLGREFPWVPERAPVGNWQTRWAPGLGTQLPTGP